MLKSIENFLEGIYFFSEFLLYFPDVSVGPRSYFFDKIEAAQDMALNISVLFTSTHRGLSFNFI